MWSMSLQEKLEPMLSLTLQGKQLITFISSTAQKASKFYFSYTNVCPAVVYLAFNIGHF